MHRRLSLEQRAIPPERVDELSEAEWLLIYTLRHWITGLRTNDPSHWSLSWNAVAKAIGPADGRETLRALNGLLREICGYARRTINHHPPCCPFVGADELHMAALIGACQRDEDETAKSLAAKFVSPAGVAGVVDWAGQVARMLRGKGLEIPARLPCSHGLHTAEWAPASSAVH